MKVLVTCDPAESHEDVFQHVVAHAWPPETSFAVLAVVLPLPAPMPHVADQLEAQATELVETLASCFRQRGLQATGMVRHGYPRLVVVHEAAELKANLVILGGARPHEKSIFLPIGSVTRTVLRSAHCSVDIARPRNSKQHEGNRVLVTTDGSEDSLAAIWFVAGRPWTKDTVFEVLSVAEQTRPVAGFYPGYLDESEMEYLTQAAISSAEKAVAEGENILRAAGLRVEAGPPVPSGAPNEQILREADRFAADLIVLGSHGARGFRQFLIGSVSEAVAMHAQCSVEVHRV